MRSPPQQHKTIRRAQNPIAVLQELLPLKSFAAVLQVGQMQNLDLGRSVRKTLLVVEVVRYELYLIIFRVSNVHARGAQGVAQPVDLYPVGAFHMIIVFGADGGIRTPSYVRCIRFASSAHPARLRQNSPFGWKFSPSRFASAHKPCVARKVFRLAPVFLPIPRKIAGRDIGKFANAARPAIPVAEAAP